MKSSKNRRQFINAGLGALGTGFLSSCASIDRILFEDPNEEKEKVVIIGGGLSGLASAYYLKKAGISFQLFEASKRWGGRLYSVPDLVRAQPVGELGGEWLTDQDKNILELCKELRVDTAEIKEVKNSKWRRGQGLAAASSLEKEMSRLMKLINTAGGEELSILEWAKAHTKDPVVLGTLDSWSLNYYGVSGDKVAAKALFKKWNQPLGPWLDRRIRIRSGTASLVKSLVDTVAGFRVDQSLKFGYRLRSIKLRNDGYILKFSTDDQGLVSVFANRVICTVPLSTLVDIEGVTDLQPSLANYDQAVGQHSKIISGYSDRFWAKEFDQSSVFEFSKGLSIWESSYRVHPLFQFRQGVLSFQFGGDAAKELGPQSLEMVKKELSSILKVNSEAIPLESVMVNWQQKTFFRGSVSYPAVGAKNRLNWEPIGRWAWAGEHTALWDCATMEGAVSSAKLAVESVQKMQTLSPKAGSFLPS